jgi:hypothetical protein
MRLAQLLAIHRLKERQPALGAREMFLLRSNDNAAEVRRRAAMFQSTL